MSADNDRTSCRVVMSPCKRDQQLSTLPTADALCSLCPHLCSCSRPPYPLLMPSVPCTLTCAAVPQVLNSLRGPWSIIFWHKSHQTLWFGRDVLGKRSAGSSSSNSQSKSNRISSSLPPGCMGGTKLSLDHFCSVLGNVSAAAVVCVNVMMGVGPRRVVPSA